MVVAMAPDSATEMASAMAPVGNMELNDFIKDSPVYTI
jgi:hypothetical protein